MVSGIDVGGGARHVAGKITDQTRRDRAHVLDRYEPPHRRSLASLVNELVEVLDP